jgi:hypothetical protein
MNCWGSVISRVALASSKPLFFRAAPMPGQVRSMRMKAKLEIDWRLISQADLQLGNRLQKKTDVSAKGFVPGLDRGPSKARKKIVDF